MIFFEALKNKVALFTDDRGKDSMLELDEVSLVEGERNNPSTNSITGYSSITIPNREGRTNIRATHNLVFMLGGIFERWKQIVAYHFTTSEGFDGARLKPIIN